MERNDLIIGKDYVVVFLPTGTAWLYGPIIVYDYDANYRLGDAAKVLEAACLIAKNNGYDKFIDMSNIEENELYYYDNYYYIDSVDASIDISGVWYIDNFNDLDNLNQDDYELVYNLVSQGKNIK